MLLDVTGVRSSKCLFGYFYNTLMCCLNVYSQNLL